MCVYDVCASSQAWHAYYKSELREVARRCEHRSGFPGFKHVFFVSALEDVGVDDLKVSNAAAACNVRNTCLTSVKLPCCHEYLFDV